MNLKKIVFSAVKILIILISLTYIVFKIYSEKQNTTLFYNTLEFNLNSWLLISIAILLMFVNWLLESVKFKLLVQNIEIISIKQSIKAVLTGITVSIFTPKRVGDFGGRVLFLKKENRVNGIFATLLGSLSQLLITLIIGSMLFPFYLSFGNLFDGLRVNIYFIFSTIAVVVIAALYAYLHLSEIGLILNKLSFFRKHNNLILFLNKYTKKELLLFLLLSFARYSIFTLQFVILLWLFGIDLTYTKAIIGISQIYFLMVLIPTFALGELGVRGSLAVWVLSTLSTSASSIITASVLLWLLNLAIPAIVGTIFLSKVKY